MSDEIPSHFEHRQRTKNLWLCAELWTDVFSMLSRADLVQRVEPVHRRFKEICEKKVRTIHLIRTADRFIDGLAKNMAEANQQYAHLAANDCPLAHQFRLIQMDIWVSRREAETNSAAYKRRRRFQMCVMRHSLDLFRDCRLHLQLPAQKGQLSFADSSEYLAYLNILYAPGPGSLELTSPCSVPYLQMDELLRQPTVLQCNRLTLVQTPKNEPTAEAICHWIHWICPIAAQPTEAGKQEEKEEEEEAEEEAEVGLELLNFDIGQLRCLNILASSSPVLNSIEEVLDRCIQNLLQAERPTDRRPFVLSFCFPANQPLKELHVQNLSSAEVLLLENVESPDTGQPTANYRLSRWPIARLGQMPEFNGRLFRSFGKFKSGSAAIEPTLVQIT